MKKIGRHIMKCEKTPFKPGWWASGEPWECDSTYCLIEYDKLPKLDPKLFQGKFQWLKEIRPGMMNSYNKKNVKELLKKAEKLDIKLPKAFITFVTNVVLQKSIPSCTACYYSLSDEFFELPGYPGCKLMRFLNDQQDILLWYLYIDSGGDHCVIVSQYFIEEIHDEDVDIDVAMGNLLRNTYFCASSFEEFIYRFWIENTLWFSLTDDLPLTPIEKDYIDAINKKK